jgi:hypothetical protein
MYCRRSVLRALAEGEMMKKILLMPALLASVSAGAFWACSSTPPVTGFGALDDAGTAQQPDVGEPGTFGDPDSAMGTKDVTISGFTYAPNGTLKLANTLVYVTDLDPAPIPEGTYCDKCITIPKGDFVFSGADGSFKISKRISAGEHKLVVQKGQFRRVRKFTVTDKGDIVIPQVDSTLPGKTDTAMGDTIPTMAVIKGTTHYDHIENSLEKLGVKDVKVLSDRGLAGNPSELKKYQVVFFPCSDQADARSAVSANRMGLRDFVESGGKLYVTDYAYEWLRQPFGSYLSWKGEGPTLGTAAGIDGEYDGPGKPVDPGLRDWLTAIGETSITLKGNWTKISSTNALPGPDEKGMQVMLTPKVWMNVTDPDDGIERPATVSFQQGCGRALFSSYHTEGDLGGGTSLIAQEKALLYILLEVTACAGTIGPPQ